MSSIRYLEAGIDVPHGNERRTLLHPTTLTLTEDRITVIGSNGSGKSTLLRMINGLAEPTAGSVTVDGADTRADGHAVRKSVGFLFTDPLAQLIMPTGVEDVALSLRRTGVRAKQRRAAALDQIARVGLADYADQSIYDLSGGQRQLMALVSVLAVSPAVLVLDEPTTLLDLQNREVLRRMLAGLDQQIVLATHDLELAADADRTLVVADGRIVYDGEPAEAVSAYRERVLTEVRR